MNYSVHEEFVDGF